MEAHLKTLRTAASNLDALRLEPDRAHAGLVQALCEAMAAQMPPADAAAAGLSVSELFETLRRHG